MLSSWDRRGLVGYGSQGKEIKGGYGRGSESSDMAATDGIGCIGYGASWQLWIGLDRYGWDGSGWVW